MNGDREMIGASDNLTLAELMQDPLIHLMMRSDGIDHGSIEALFATTFRAAIEEEVR